MVVLREPWHSKPQPPQRTQLFAVVAAAVVVANVGYGHEVLLVFTLAEWSTRCNKAQAKPKGGGRCAQRDVMSIKRILKITVNNDNPKIP